MDKVTETENENREAPSFTQPAMRNRINLADLLLFFG